MKRFLSILLIASMLLSMLVLPATAVSSTGGASMSTVAAATVETLPEYTGGTKTYTDTYNGCLLMTVKGTNATEFNTYLTATLTGAGFAPVKGAAHDVLGASNKTAMYQNANYLINAFFDASSNTASITIEPNTYDTYDLSVFDPDSAAEGDITPLLIQVGLDSRRKDSDLTAFGTTDSVNNSRIRYSNGMSYIYRLSDGRFIVLDGGGGSSAAKDSSANDAQKVKMENEHAARLLQAMIKYNKTENGGAGGELRIATWYITHPHQDHMLGFQSFVNNYVLHATNKFATVESVICNLPNVETQSNGTSRVSVSKIGEYQTVLTNLSNAGTTVWKAHPGQKYYFNNLAIEILVTADVLTDHYSDIANNSSGDMTNTFSVMSQMTLTSGEEEHTMLWTGDSTWINIVKANALYGSALKSDFMQVPHHGFTNPQLTVNFTALNNFYTWVNAKYILIPTELRSASKFIDGEPGDDHANLEYSQDFKAATASDYVYDEDGKHTHETKQDADTKAPNPNYHLQIEALKNGGNVYVARNHLTLFTFNGESVGAPVNDAYTLSTDEDRIASGGGFNEGSTTTINGVTYSHIDKDLKIVAEATAGSNETPTTKIALPATTDDGYTLIYTAYGLKQMASTGKYKLANDITVTGAYTSSFYDADFKGTLHGNGHTIDLTNASFTFSTASAGAIFAKLDSAVVTNLNVIGINVRATATANFGGLASNVIGNTTVSNVCLEGALTSSGGNLGGFFGQANDSNASKTVTIQNCTFNGVLTSSSGTAGGLIGRAGGGSSNFTINNCVVSGSVTGNSAVGGFIGNAKTSGVIAVDKSVVNATVGGNVSSKGFAIGKAETALTSASSITNCISFYNNADHNLAWAPSGITVADCAAPKVDFVMDASGAEPDAAEPRFRVNVDADFLKGIYAAGFTVKLGSLVSFKATVDKAGAFTMAALDEIAPAGKTVYKTTEYSGADIATFLGEYDYYRITVKNANKANGDYVAVGYITVTVGGRDVTVYTPYTAA